MTTIEIDGSRLRVVVKGVDKILALKSVIEVPLTHVKSAALQPGGAGGPRSRGWRLPGTSVPGIITAGSYLKDATWLFIDVRDSKHTIKIDLDHEHYAAMIIDVQDPAGDVDRINTAIAARE